MGSGETRTGPCPDPPESPLPWTITAIPINLSNAYYIVSMDDTISNNPGSEGDLLQPKLEVQELQAQVLDLRMKNESLQKELAQMRRENAQLKRMPLFVAAVVEVMENGEIYLRQQGNNQEYITQANEELHKTLKPGTKVAVNNALSIVKVIGNIYDARVRIMELDESPDVTFEKIGGLKKEIEEVREAVDTRSRSPRSSGGSASSRRRGSSSTAPRERERP